MKKIMIIGCCGAGKSTLARALHQRTSLELIHLDQHYWRSGWIEPEAKEWEKTVRQLVKKKTWIIDGNYGGTMDIRLAQADTIILLHYPTWLCLKRVIQRIWKNHGKARADMPRGCKERFNLPFLWYVLNFNRRKLPGILAKLKNIKKETAIFTLSNDQEVQHFLAQLTNTQKTATNNC